MHHAGGTGYGRDSVHSVGNRDTFARISAFPDSPIGNGFEIDERN